MEIGDKMAGEERYSTILSVDNTCCQCSFTNTIRPTTKTSDNG